jgi:hypothetical protein
MCLCRGCVATPVVSITTYRLTQKLVFYIYAAPTGAGNTEQCKIYPTQNIIWNPSSEGITWKTLR